MKRKTTVWILRPTKIHGFGKERETESLFIAAENNAIRTYCIKAKIDGTQ